MNTEDFLSCDVCKELFDGLHRIPRMLECGHSFCSQCLSSIVFQVDINKCPMCQAYIRYISVFEIPVNYNLKQLAENFKTSGGETFAARSSCDSHGFCILHKSNYKYICNTCTSNKFLCSKCVQIDHKNCKPILISTLTKSKCSRCDSKYSTLLKDCCYGEERLKKLTNDVVTDLQIYLNLLDEQENNLKLTRNVVECLNSNLTSIYGLDDQINSKSKIYTSEKKKNLRETSYAVMVTRENEIETEEKSVKGLLRDLDKCEIMIRSDLLSRKDTLGMQNKPSGGASKDTALTQILEFNKKTISSIKNINKKAK